jgi:hypothetical protein
MCLFALCHCAPTTHPHDFPESQGTSVGITALERSHGRATQNALIEQVPSLLCCANVICRVFLAGTRRQAPAVSVAMGADASLAAWSLTNARD